VTAWPERFRFLDDLSEMRSIHLDPWREGVGATVTSVAPRGYGAYVRILHPASRSNAPVRWSEIASASGATLHPLAQWDLIAPDPDDGPWISRPEQGAPSSAILSALVSLLGNFTMTADRCFFGIWGGWGYLNDSSGALARETTDPHQDSVLGRWRVKRARRSSSGAPANARSQFISELAAEAASFPMLEFEPGRGRPYLLGTGPLDVILQIADDTSFDHPGVPVAMWWPDDRAWFVSSEIDFDSTVVAGSPELRDLLLSDPELEAFDVPPDGILSLNGDSVNDEG
jgi:hypothetical protein